jgi:E3 SUMO-protein ligase RanBP2
VKILHHPQNNTYRLLLRREQVHKLVLNQLITGDFSMKLMNTSGKAYLWNGMNYADPEGAAEQLAVRFKNEDLAQSFKVQIDKCLEKLSS